jgi:hypothetical protein
MQEIEIDETNFGEHFRDVRVCDPSKGDVIAQYSASAEFVDGGEKRQVISLLSSTENKMEATAQVMRKLLFASEKDAYRVPRLMAEDLLSGMTEDDVAAKPYKYTLEMFFYTKPDNVPKGDPHWSSISLLNVDEVCGKTLNGVESRLVVGEQGDDSYVDGGDGEPESGSEASCGNARGVQVSEA